MVKLKRCTSNELSALILVFQFVVVVGTTGVLWKPETRVNIRQ
jgi:hypothetical protein